MNHTYSKICIIKDQIIRNAPHNDEMEKFPFHEIHTGNLHIECKPRENLASILTN